MIIDFHTHVFPEKIAAATVSALERIGNTSSFSDGTVNGLISRMEKAGIGISVNLPVITKPSQFDSVLKFAVSLNEVFKNSPSQKPRIISFAGMHPDIDSPEEKLAIIKESGILGIKIHPDYQGTYIDDERYIRILAEAKRLGLITVTHAGFDSAYPGQPIKCTPKRVLAVLDKIGGYDKLVLAHMGGNKLFSEVYDLLAGKDVYFDTAFVLPLFDEEKFKKVLQKHGDKRLLFATDSPWRDTHEDVCIIKSYSLDPMVEKRIFWENAAELLKI